MEIGPLIQKNFVYLDSDLSLSKYVAKLKENKAILVYKNSKYYGIIDKNQLLKTRFNSKEIKIGSFVQKTPILSEHTGILETADLLFQSNFEYLPVEIDKKIVGIISAGDIINAAFNLPEIKKCLISEFKILNPAKIQKEDPVSKALNILNKENLEQIPIFNGDKLFGTLNLNNLIENFLKWPSIKDTSSKSTKNTRTKAARTDKLKFASIPITAFCSTNIISISLNKDWSKAIQLLQKHNLTNLFIKDKNSFAGILNIKNILRYIISQNIPTNYNIRFIGLNKTQLDVVQKKNLKKIASNEAYKLQRDIKNDFKLAIHIKEYKKEGGKQKYSIDMRLDYPGKMIAISQSDWKVKTALRKTFNNAKNKLLKQFKD